ncbi:MAG: hypothetical protein JWN17_2925, partial [Frankiales bacterium]|nr:hypothetical protein [Frankiales bacterium]
MSAPTLRPVPRPTLPRGGPSQGSPLRAGAAAALWALVAGLVAVGLPVLLVWGTDERSSTGALAAVRAAGQVWLVAHAVPLALPAGRLSVVPLGLVLVPLALLVRAGSAAARAHRVADLRGAGRLTVAVAGPYAVAASAVAACSASSAARPSVAGALVGAACVAALGAGAGVVRTSGLDAALRA